jgi:predicted MFS family arabinose efflux permease
MAQRLSLSIAPSLSGGRHFQFILLIIAATVAAYARAVISPLQETIRIALALSDNQIALLQGPALALPMIVIAIPLGLLIDRYSRTRLLLIFAILNLAGSLLTALSSNFVMLFTSRCLVGLAVAAINTTAFALLGDLYAPAQRGRATMSLVVGQYAGSGAAFVLGGTVLVLSGNESSGWHWTMLWLTGPLAVIVLSTIALREPPRAGVSIENPTRRETFAGVWRYGASIAPLFAGMVLFEMAVCAVLTWASPTMSRNFALAPDRVGVIMMVTVSGGGLVGSIVGGILADLCQRTAGPSRTLWVASGLALACAPASLFAVLPGVALASVLLLLFMTLICAALVMGMALFTIVIPNEVRGLCMAGMSAGQVLLGVGLAPVLVSLLSGALGGPAMIGKALALVIVMTSLLGAAAFAFGRQYLKSIQPPTPQLLKKQHPCGPSIVTDLRCPAKTVENE